MDTIVPALRQRWVPRGIACGLAALVLAAPAAAQTVYRWTDDRGVVHFSDMPPPNAAGVEERTLSAQPVVRGAGEPTPAADQGSAADTADAPTRPAAGPPPAGPARVVVMTRDTPRTGPSALRITGQVRNAGAETARNVSVEVTVVDETQGTVCLRTVADVDPPTLAGGETGTFDLALDDPCLFGTPNLDIEPQWD